MDESWSGHLSIQHIEEYIQRVGVLVREDQQIILAQVTSIVGISYGYAHPIVHYDLGYCNVCAGWVSKHTTEKLVLGGGVKKLIECYQTCINMQEELYQKVIYTFVLHHWK